jgi:hypothetical protein
VSKFKTHTITFYVTRENDDVELEIEGSVNADSGQVEVLSIHSDNRKWGGELNEVETTEVEEAILEKSRDDAYWDEPGGDDWADDGSLEDVELDDVYDPT